MGQAELKRVDWITELLVPPKVSLGGKAIKKGYSGRHRRGRPPYPHPVTTDSVGHPRIMCSNLMSEIVL